MDLHSLMVLRHGHVVAEGWWAPYHRDDTQLLYSLSKSFTSSAVGIAEAEGLLSLDDPVASFFPDQLPEGPGPLLMGMKVRHLLAMASGHTRDTRPFLRGPDIVRSFLSLRPKREPGTYFCYNAGCTFTLSAIITKLTGQRLVDYLRPRLFGPLGIGTAFWDQAQPGIDQGFSGLYLRTEAVAKLGQLYLQDGRWDGAQVVPRAYVEQARSRQVDSAHHSGNPDWGQGYGFQFWLCRHNAFRGDGAFGQLCVVVPEAEAVIVCTAQVEDMQLQLDLMWQHLLPAVSGHAEGDRHADEALAARLAALSVPVPQYGLGLPKAPTTFTRAGEIVPYTEELSTIRAEQMGKAVRLTVLLGQQHSTFDLRPGQWERGKLLGVEEPLCSVAVTGGWGQNDELDVDIVFLSLPHRLQLRGRQRPKPEFEAHWQTTPL